MALTSAMLAMVSLALPASAQQLSLAPPDATASSEYLRRGQLLEGERRWGEAVAHYEEAIRQFPADSSLKQRFDFVRQHYDVARRYADRSFRDSLSRLSYRSMLDLYGEVLLKMHAHSVESPRWREILDSGTRALDVALSEPSFLEANLSTIDTRTLDAFREELGRLMAARPVTGRADLRDAVAAAAALAQQRLEIAPGAVTMEYLCGAANSLDQYSTFLTSDQLTEVYSQIKGNFVGLGIELKAQDGTLLIVRVIPNSPAKRSGLREGDRIVSIDGRLTRGLSADRAANLLQGESGTTADLVVERTESQPLRILVRRERVEVPGVDDARILDPSRHVAYLRLSCFQETTVRDLEDALWTLHRAGMRSLIVDVRGNPGGLLVSAVEVADLFLNHGVIVATHGRNAYEDFTYTAREQGTWRVPLVVLIDQDSASAAEIFAGAIHDHQRGTIVGQRSFGKGSVQGIFPLTTAGAGLRLTTAKFFSPLGKPYSGVGVEPNIIVRQAAKPVAGPLGPGLMSPDQDATLAAALQAATQLMAQR